MLRPFRRDASIRSVIPALTVVLIASWITLRNQSLAEAAELNSAPSGPITSFVIGDLNADVGQKVMFWGAQWASNNSLRGGPAPRSFKGWAGSTTPGPATCGGTWKTTGGNSSNPPSSVPRFITVIVASSITPSQSTISGNIAKMVVVQTDPGYGPDPGHGGTGTVVAVYCAACVVGTVCRPSAGQCDAAEICDANGQCPADSPTPGGTACNDGNACTQIDTCQGGVCSGGNPVTCVAQDQCHVAGTCDPATGQCSNPVSADGTACNDGNACTQSDACHAGTCAGANPVTCSAQDQCHVAGTCDPGTGQCSNPVSADGTACNDGNGCTQSDSCQAGTCTGSNPVTCTALDQCHVAGTCDPGTGRCNNPTAADGASCDDGSACSQADACQAGACVGGSPLNCDDDNECTADSCDSATGCHSVAVADGTACTSGACQVGACQPSSPTCQDGLQNGNETGVDCGGPDCPACGVAACQNCGPDGTACPVPGDGWTFSDSGFGCNAIFGTRSCCSFGCTGACGTSELKPHTVTFFVAGQSLTFRFAPTWDGCITGATAYISRWSPAPNTQATVLTPQGEALFLLAGDPKMVYQDTFEVYNPQTFRIRLANGDEHVVDRTQGFWNEQCDTGQPAMCAAGTTQCQGGAVVCAPNNAHTETCNGRDDDCDGVVDDGAICPPGTSCVAGTCQADTPN